MGAAVAAKISNILRQVFGIRGKNFEVCNAFRTLEPLPVTIVIDRIVPRSSEI